MRILLAFLIVLNLLYAGWQYMSPVDTGQKLPPMPDNLKSLELLNEPEFPVVSAEELDQQTVTQVADEQQEELAESIAANEAGLDPAEITESCYTLGPFKDRDIMQQLKDSLSQQVSEVAVRKRTESEKHRYWVYIPASGGRKGAKQLARKLRDKKVNDFYIVLKGDAKNSVSLGHFREQAHANRRLRRINKLGFNAAINVIYRDYDVYWLDYRVTGPDYEQGFNADEYHSEGVSVIGRECQTGGN